MPKHSGESKNGFVISGRRPLACVASVSVLFRSKERPRNEILGFGRARNETRAKKWRGPCSETAPKRLLRRLAAPEGCHPAGAKAAAPDGCHPYSPYSGCKI